MSDYVKRKEELSALKSKSDLKEILDAACAILGNPVYIHDMDYVLIACGGNLSSNDPFWREMTETGRMSIESKRVFADEGMLEEVADARKSAILSSEVMKYSRIVGKLVDEEKVQMGYVCVIGSKNPFQGEDQEDFEILCDLLSEKLGADEHFREKGREFQEKIIRELIGGLIDDRRSYTASVESLYSGLKRRLFLAVVDISAAEADGRGVGYYKDELKHAVPEYRYFTYGKSVIIIMSADRGDLPVRRAMTQFERALRRFNLYMGISGGFENLFLLGKHYSQALEALSRAGEDQGGQRVFRYEES